MSLPGAACEWMMQTLMSITCGCGCCRIGTGNTQHHPCILTDELNQDHEDRADVCFLGHDRLLVLSDNFKLYSIEDTSQAPQPLARFLIPVSVISISRVECVLPIDDSPQPLPMQVHQMMWTSDPKYQLLISSMYSSYTTFVFIISTRIFFDLKEWQHNYHGKTGAL
ncbi:hypothetical protein EDB19DRAFT_1273838 [Suillus lakei]|nr:hypothetical protein EDB19DRAFT_1273838 [Suillus lakei]